MDGINPEVLVWARKRAQMSKKEAVRKLQIGDAKSLNRVERLAALEAGEIKPTTEMLIKMADVYQQTLLVFYMPHPPIVASRGTDFRHSSKKSDPRTESLLDFQLRDIQVGQKMVKALLLDEPDCEALSFVNSRSISDGKQACLRSIKDWAGFSTHDYRAQKSPADAFRVLRESIEQQGVFINLVSVLGSRQKKICPASFRGYVLSDEIAPFIVINEQDSFPARSFTLLHEFVHLLLGDTGISGDIGDNKVERFCSAVASEFLLSAEELDELDVHSRMGIDEAIEAFETFAITRHLSHNMVVQRAYQAKLIEKETYFELTRIFKSRQQQKRSDQEFDSLPYADTKRDRFGGNLLGLISQKMATCELTTTKAARILGVSPMDVHSLIRSE